ncbi:MAG: transketolase C-terminal domain-containing protein, partial [Nitrospira sp.]
TVEEGSTMGGFGSAVLESLSEQGITNISTKLLGLPDWYIEQGPQEMLREKYGLTEDGIYKEAKALWTRMTTAPGAVSSAASNRLRAVQGGKGVSFPGLKGADGDEQGS